MTREKLRRRVSALMTRATHPGTPPEEAAASRAVADRLTRRYGLNQPEFPTFLVGAAIRPVIVHWMSGFSPSGNRSRAWCRCGYGTSPRVTECRALRALTDSHSLDVAECVLCGVVYPADDWVNFRGRLQVVKDPTTGDEFSMCINPKTCKAVGF
ncbi:DUF2786 domain-containing protein [Amycolatopsis australiensis]|uniref:DUF2786 domain-containing protein n=1 Tax=Amycolatopsis australiensis TaxID=546364 RepID=UPI001C431966|nr:DUF2786 domain-containing protein [Amycolatopsis australiensis]